MEESKRNQIGEKLELSEIKLDALLKVTIGINENLSKDELLQIYSSVLLNDLKIGKVGLFICNIDDIESCFVRGFQKEKINALDWNKIPDFKSEKVVKDGFVDDIVSNVSKRKENYGLVLSGNILIPKKDIYTFYLRSNDGSRLKIGDKNISEINL